MIAQGMSSSHYILLEQLIPQDHLVRKIDAVINVDFIYDAIEELYSENTGKSSVDFLILIKMALLQYIFECPLYAAHHKRDCGQLDVSFVFRSWSRMRKYRNSTTKRTRTGGSTRRSLFDALHNSTKKNRIKKVNED